MVVSVMFKKGGESPLFLNQISRILQKGVYKYNKLDPAIDFQRHEAPTHTHTHTHTHTYHDTCMHII
jgi:hypothetical protein